MVIILGLCIYKTCQDRSRRVPLHQLLFFTKPDLVRFDWRIVAVITYKVQFRLGDDVDFVNPTIIEV